MEHERLGQVKQSPDPRANQCADEAEGGRHEHPAARSATERLADSAADGGDDDEHDEAWKGDGHGLTV
jgi:hypothetical protein